MMPFVSRDGVLKTDGCQCLTPSGAGSTRRESLTLEEGASGRNKGHVRLHVTVLADSPVVSVT
jgi:hypothetical protein